ncbi:MAG: type II toxin-antitoxin system death-on-curing family toxin [Planctomycetaceae bacterium]|nr:type II toxin-antitoxin system death-on-curing family toxin [Planctomycetaceae bacterium]
MITFKEIMFLHEAALLAHGGSDGILNEHSIHSALAQPEMTFGGQLLFPTLWLQAAALGRSLICNHGFVDGNKRVGFAAMVVFLRQNGFDLSCTPDEGEQIGLDVAKGEVEVEQLAVWLESHAIKMDTAS